MRNTVEKEKNLHEKTAWGYVCGGEENDCLFECPVHILRVGDPLRNNGDWKWRKRPWSTCTETRSMPQNRMSQPENRCIKQIKVFKKLCVYLEIMATRVCVQIREIFFNRYVQPEVTSSRYSWEWRNRWCHSWTRLVELLGPVICDVRLFGHVPVDWPAWDCRWCTQLGPTMHDAALCACVPYRTDRQIQRWRHLRFLIVHIFIKAQLTKFVPDSRAETFSLQMTMSSAYLNIFVKTEHDHRPQSTATRQCRMRVVNGDPVTQLRALITRFNWSPPQYKL